MTKNLTIAIDGPAGSGKSTTARLVAQRLGYAYIDTGAMYRAMALKALREGVDPKDRDAVAELADRTRIELKQQDGAMHIYLDGEDVTEKLRLPEVTKAVTPVCQVNRVRQVLVEQQRQIGRNGAVVMEGRDIGTVVLPRAELKIFLNASLQERAKRRYLELRAQGLEIPLRQLKKQMAQRDKQDMSRAQAPLRKAEDAILIDTTKLTIEEQVDKIVNLAKSLSAEDRNGQDS
ncbi:MAG: (d)CMP kinase [Candidatus Latescibacterota bacterium]|nr:MAG: (d)CMP kinase [Candidatus Latescibacterota bacterium]